MKMLTGLFTFLLSVLSFLFCTGHAFAEEPTAFKIGGAFALTGFAAAWGQAEQNGTSLAVEDFNARGGINGSHVSLVSEDIQSTSIATVNAVTKLISVDKVRFIVGPTWLDTFRGAVPIAERNKTVLITPSGSIDAIKSGGDYNHVFSTWFPADKEALALLEYLKSKNLHRMVLLLGDDPFWELFRKVYKDNADSYGITIVDDYKISGALTDLRAHVLKIKSKPDTFIFFGLNEEGSIQAFLKQRKELGLNAQLFTTEYIEEYKSNSAFKGYLGGINFVAPKIRQSDFPKRYKQKFGSDPVFSASNAYDATNIALQSLSQSLQSKLPLKDIIKDGTFKTITFGPLNFDSRGGVSKGEFEVRTITE